MCHRTTATPLPPLSISRAGPVRDVGPSGHTDCHPGRAQGAATAPKAGTMFPTRDLIDGYERLLERDRVHQLLLEAHPDLADRIEVDEANPLLRIPTGLGGALILWKGEHEGIIRWRMAAPDGEGVSVVEPDSIAEFPELVAEKLGESA